MNRTIGIMGAMPEEINGVAGLLQGVKTIHSGKRNYYTGQINGIDVVVVFSRWGKVAAASTAATLIHRFNITDLLFTGVAGAIQPNLKAGDIVIGKQLIQHDLDARPLIQKHEIPLLNKIYLEADAKWLLLAEKTIHELLQEKHLHRIIDNKTLDSFNLHHPNYYIGAIASGDQFFFRQEQKTGLLSSLPNIYCVEMEGASVAQVCYENDIPCLVIRTISDSADEQSPYDFAAFVDKIASTYSTEIVKNIFKYL